MGRVWDTSKDPPKSFVSLCQFKVIQGHQAKNVKFQIVGLCCLVHIFKLHFDKNAENDPRALFLKA